MKPSEVGGVMSETPGLGSKNFLVSVHKEKQTVSENIFDKKSKVQFIYSKNIGGEVNYNSQGAFRQISQNLKFCYAPFTVR